MINIEPERKRLGYTQNDLAKKIGVSRAAVRDWENGKTPIKSSFLVAMADLFGCSTDWLLGRSEERLVYRRSI